MKILYTCTNFRKKTNVGRTYNNLNILTILIAQKKDQNSCKRKFLLYNIEFKGCIPSRKLMKSCVTIQSKFKFFAKTNESKCIRNCDGFRSIFIKKMIVLILRQQFNGTSQIISCLWNASNQFNVLHQGKQTYLPF